MLETECLKKVSGEVLPVTPVRARSGVTVVGCDMGSGDGAFQPSAPPRGGGT